MVSGFSRGFGQAQSLSLHRSALARAAPPVHHCLDREGIPMPFVKRNAEGAIVSASHEAEGDCVEEISEAELLASGFLDRLVGTDGSEGLHLANSDLELVRVIEDVVDLLVEKGVILFTELPESAQKKVLARQQLRSRIGGSLNLLGDD
jgi:hypothetical protein